MTCPHCRAPNADDARFCGACGRATSATEPASSPDLGEAPQLIGREISGRYRMLSKLGEGGMGAVYRAEQISLKRTVAVKLLRPEVAASPMLLRRFNAEAEAVAKLSHPNTVNIYDFGQDADGTLFIAMEYIEGTSLRSVIHHAAPLPLRRAIGIAMQVAASLTDAHAHSIIHRDLKPDNVMLQERGRQRDVVRVLDFGIAKLRDENRESQLAMTQAGDMLGTPQYMAPEQIRAETIDGRTDVYALGCMLYEMVTARLPFEAPTVMSLLSKHLLEVTVPPSQRRPDLGLPPVVDELILRAMAKDPKVRPPTMEAFGEELAAVMATLPVDPSQVTSPHLIGSAGASPPSVPTPPAYSAAPLQPPPSAPPHAPVGALPAYPPPGYPSPPYDPHAGRTPDIGSVTAPPKRSKAALWAVIGLLAVGGTSAGIYFGVVQPSSGAATADAGSAGSGTVADPPVGGVIGPATGADTTPRADPWGGTRADPWGRDTGGTTPDHTRPAAKRVFGTKLAQGVTLDLPRGFTVNDSGADVFVATDARGVAIIAGKIDSASNDIDQLAAEYASENNVELDRIEYDVIAGERRAVATFRGEVEGIQAVHMVAALIGPGYRVAVVVLLPVAAASRDSSVREDAIDLFKNRLAVP